MNEMQECGKEDPLQQMVKEPALTNGHTHLHNGALKPEDLSPVTDPTSVDMELPEYRATTPPGQLQTKPDPYEFPHSPPKRSDYSFDLLEETTLGDNEERPIPFPPTDQGAASPHQHLKQHQASCEVDSKSEETPKSSASFPHSPLRLNGSHHNAFSSDPASLNTNNPTAKPDPPSEKSSSSTSSFKTSTQLQAQTSGLISEFYSHSRLHQISTWRSGFSEYVNELHSKRKTAGGASFPGKDRLRKSLGQRLADSQGRK